MLPSQTSNPRDDGCRFTRYIGESHSATAVRLVLNKTEHCHGYISGKLRAIRNQTKIPLKKSYKTKLDIGRHKQCLSFLDHCGASFCGVSCISGGYLLCGSSGNPPCLRSQRHTLEKTRRRPLEKSAVLIRSSCRVCWFLLVRQGQFYIHLLEN